MTPTFLPLAAALCVLTAAAPLTAAATSFMLAPGAPTAAELAARIVALEAELARTLTGPALAEFQRDKAARDADALREAGAQPPSDAHRYGRLERRWRALDELRRRSQAAPSPGR